MPSPSRTAEKAVSSQKPPCNQGRAKLLRLSARTAETCQWARGWNEAGVRCEAAATDVNDLWNNYETKAPTPTLRCSRLIMVSQCADVAIYKVHASLCAKPGTVQRAVVGQ